jgi:hypothetical protein
MLRLTHFLTEYIIQTRKEIDTEKRERDHILNFAVVILGAIAFAVYQSETAQRFLFEPLSLIIQCTALVVITSLFWVRWMKLRQIADRWFVLHRILLRRLGEEEAADFLESLVAPQLLTTRYIRKDLVLNYALSSPIYCLLIAHCYIGFTRIEPILIAFPLAVIFAHIIISEMVLNRTIRDPFTDQPVTNRNAST